MINSKQKLLTAQISMYEVLRELLRDIPRSKVIRARELFDNIRVLPLDDGAVLRSA